MCSQYLILILSIICPYYFNVYVTHHSNAGLPISLLSLSYLAIFTGYDYFWYLSAIQLQLPYFCLAYTFHDHVIVTFFMVPYLNWKPPCSLGMASGNFQWSTISSINSYWYTSLSTCSKKCYNSILDANIFLSLFKYSTSDIWVSNDEFSFCIPTGVTS